MNIPVYEVRPGIIETDMTAGVKEKYDKLINEGLTIENAGVSRKTSVRLWLPLLVVSFLTLPARLFTRMGDECEEVVIELHNSLMALTLGANKDI